MIDEGRMALSFFKTLFGSKPDDAYIVVGALKPHVEMQSFRDPFKAAAYAAGRNDMYVHVGVTRRVFQGRFRPSAQHIDGLACQWADVDVLHPVHGKTNLPPSRDAALEVIRAMGLPATMVVDSGHGLQAYWVYREMTMFEDEAQRREAMVLARAWGITLRERAKALGYGIDMVSDIARILRVPGTFNTKQPDAVAPVQVLA